MIDDKEQYLRLVRFVEMFMPTRVKDIQYYSGDEPIFDAYGIEDEIAPRVEPQSAAAQRRLLDHRSAEALTAIDVNTGRYVGKGSRDLEETAFKTNLEAIEEIAYQLRFRNIGGLVILGFDRHGRFAQPREGLAHARDAARQRQSQDDHQSHQ
ncbi:MAG: ribonuclease E/G [Pseudomonadota bacterium]